MKKPLLMVRDADNVILGCMWQDDPDTGPTKPQHPAPEGVTLVDDPAATTFTREGHGDYEVATFVNGAVVWTDSRILEATIEAALDQIDASCEAVRQAAVAKRTLKADEYAQAEAQATAWKAANYTGDAPQDVQSWANAKWRDLMTPQQAADDILTQAVEYRTLLSHIRALRLTDMENVRHATTTEEIDTIMTQFLKDLASLGSP